ncbi:hypothetical protein KKC32_04305 [Patescibacteria group bacterium]|nr:hypothetical protein [Patescibacteria group bacterium]
MEKIKRKSIFSKKWQLIRSFAVLFCVLSIIFFSNPIIRWTDLAFGYGSTAGDIFSPPRPVFSVEINDGAINTYSRNVSIDLDGGIDARTMALSNSSDFDNVSLEPYNIVKEWDLCSVAGAETPATCAYGIYTVYVKFFTANGIASEIITDTINLAERPPAVRRDSNGDGKIDEYELNLILENWGSEEEGNISDFNDDGIVDIYDFNLLMILWSGESLSAAASPTAPAMTKVILSPAVIEISPQKTFTINIDIDPQGIKNYTVKMQALFPADLVEVQSFKFAADTVELDETGYSEIDNKKGILIKTSGFPGGISTKTNFGSITFLTKKAGSGNIKIGDESFAFDSNGEDVLYAPLPQSKLTVKTAVPTKEAAKPAAPAKPAVPAEEKKPVEEKPVPPAPVEKPAPEPEKPAPEVKLPAEAPEVLPPEQVKVDVEQRISEAQSRMLLPIKVIGGGMGVLLLVIIVCLMIYILRKK